MPKLATNIAYMFTERPLLERIGAAARAGFKAIELQFPYDHPPPVLSAEVEKHGLTVLGTNTERGGGENFGLAAVPGREKDFDALFAQALDYISAVGGSAIHCLAGKVDKHDRAAAEKTFVANLARNADAAAAKNITLLLEPINDIDRPNYLLNYVEQAADVIAKAGKPNIKIQYDFYHVQIMQGDLLRRFEKHQSVVGHVQIAGVPKRHEPDEGEVNYPAVFETLDALGYNGWVAGEYRPRGKTEDGLGWAKPYGVTPKHT